MPVGEKIITATRGKDKGKAIKVHSYFFEPNMKPLGVIYGCFSPFTGKYGHGRLLEAGAKAGIHDFLIVIPNKDDTWDDERNMFDNQQKCDIAVAAAKDLGYNVIDGFVKRQITGIDLTLRGLASKYPDRRIVLICGPDRAEEYGQYCIPFKKSNKESLDDNPGQKNPYEFIVLNDRGEREVSGTKVRAAIKENNKKEFLYLTGYSEDMWDYIHNMALKNGLGTRQAAKAGDAPAPALQARHGLKHLYNPGNSQQMTPPEFEALVAELNKTGGVLKNHKNVSVTEKADGSSFVFGLERDGKFFVQRGTGSPKYSIEDIVEKCKEATGGKITLDAYNFAKIFKKLSINKNIRSILEKANQDGIRITTELLLTDNGLKENGKVRFVGTTYDLDKLGSTATLVLIRATDGHDKAIPSEKIFKQFESISNDDIRFDNVELSDVPDIDISEALEKANAGIKSIEAEYKADGGVEAVLNNKDRTKPTQMKKKDIKAKFEELQKALNDSIDSQLAGIGGKWGDEYEGRVFKLKDGTMFKITSQHFKDFKKQHSMDWDEHRKTSYIDDAEKQLDDITENRKKTFARYILEQTKPMITEKFSGKNILLYTTSKDDSFEKFFGNKSLRFANNAGNMYGLGIYTTLELPKDADVGYSEKGRAALYGNNIYELAAPSNRFFYLLWDYFVMSSLHDILGSTKETFIADQLKYFKIKATEDEIASFNPAVIESNGQCAYNFYKFMNTKFYQRKDGTLDSPIIGFIYYGRNDGLVGVVWSPYDCNMTRKSVNGGEWEKIGVRPGYDASDDDVVERIFDGNKTPEKDKVYRLLCAYKGDNTPLGQFTDIVIHDDKTIDATFKSNVPQVDGYRHCYLIMENPYINDILDLGYRFGTLNGWLKLGQSSQGHITQMYMPSNAPKRLLPKTVTEGIYLTGVPNLNDKEIAACKRINIKNDTLVIRKSYVTTTDLGFGTVVLRDCIIADDCYDEIVGKYVCDETDKKKSEVDAAAAAKEKAKAEKEAAKKAAEEAKAQRAAEREAKRKAKEEEKAAKETAKAAKAAAKAKKI